MTEIEILTKRWDLIQQARLSEAQHLMSQVPKQLQLGMISALNTEPFWEGLFDQLETQLRERDPNHSYLPENQIEL